MGFSLDCPQNVEDSGTLTRRYGSAAAAYTRAGGAGASAGGGGGGCGVRTLLCWLRFDEVPSQVTSNSDTFLSDDISLFIKVSS